MPKKNKKLKKCKSSNYRSFPRSSPFLSLAGDQGEDHGNYGNYGNSENYENRAWDKEEDKDKYFLGFPYPGPKEDNWSDSRKGKRGRQEKEKETEMETEMETETKTEIESVKEKPVQSVDDMLHEWQQETSHAKRVNTMEELLKIWNRKWELGRELVSFLYQQNTFVVLSLLNEKERYDSGVQFHSVRYNHCVVAVDYILIHPLHPQILACDFLLLLSAWGKLNPLPFCIYYNLKNQSASQKDALTSLVDPRSHEEVPCARARIGLRAKEDWEKDVTPQVTKTLETEFTSLTETDFPMNCFLCCCIPPESFPVQLCQDSSPLTSPFSSTSSPVSPFSSPFSSLRSASSFPYHSPDFSDSSASDPSQNFQNFTNHELSSLFPFSNQDAQSAPTSTLMSTPTSSTTWGQKDEKEETAGKETELDVLWKMVEYYSQKEQKARAVEFVKTAVQKKESWVPDLEILTKLLKGNLPDILQGSRDLLF